MSLPLHPSQAATDDVTELYCFFYEREANLGERFLECLNETYEMIRHMPELGELYRFRDPVMKDARIRPVKKFSNYLIFYRIEANRIEILRVLHGARDYANLFSMLGR
jgi:toxin ParE1/3/4